VTDRERGTNRKAKVLHARHLPDNPAEQST
jgi:hypothetical protein